MGWVPPYSIGASQAAVTTDFGGVGAKDGLTRVGLQFWVVRANGSIRYDPGYAVGDRDVQWWTAWGKNNGIKILLTVDNNDGSWSWAVARSAFTNNRKTLVNALVSEMERLGLDGVDVDFEGLGSLDSDRAAFAAFIVDLSVAVKAKGKLLTVDSFHYIWNAPNQNWWADWVGKVDGIHPMGYHDLYEGGASYRKYSFQQNAGVNAGYPSSAILMGFPSWMNAWGVSSGRGKHTLAHLGEVRYDLDEPTGIAIWDLRLIASSWRTAAVWQEIAALKAINGNGEASGGSP